MKTAKIKILSQCPPDLGNQNTPVIVKGGCADWPAIGKWTESWFSEVLGHLAIPLTDNVNYPHAAQQSKKHISVKEYIEALKNDKNFPFYLAGWKYQNYFRQLAEDIKVPPAFRNNQLDKIASLFGIDYSTLFIGHKAVDSPTHTDSHFMATYLCLVDGKKSIRLVEPNSRYDKKEIHNGLDLFTAQLSADILVFEGEVEKGDFVYIPAGWWHHVRNETDFTVAISNNFLGPCQLQAFEQNMRLMLWKKISELADIRRSLFEGFDESEFAEAQAKYLSKGKYAEFEIEYLQILMKEVS